MPLLPSPFPDASATARGAVNTLAQIFAGQKTFSSGIALSDGLVGTPSLSFASDPNTGFYWLSADRFSVVTNGIQVMEWDSVRRTKVYGLLSTNDVRAETDNACDLGTGALRFRNAYLSQLLTMSATSGTNFLTALDGARLNFSTADTSSYLYRGSSNCIQTPGAIIADSGFQAQGATNYFWRLELNDSWLTGTKTTVPFKIASGITAVAAGATAASAAIAMFPTNALDAADWVLSVGNAANAASLFSVAYNGTVTATGNILLPVNTSIVFNSPTNTGSLIWDSNNGRINLYGGLLIQNGGLQIANAGTLSTDGAISSTIASGGNAYKSVDGARWNLSTADTSAYLSRTATDTIKAQANFVVGSFFQASSWAFLLANSANIGDMGTNAGTAGSIFYRSTETTSGTTVAHRFGTINPNATAGGLIVGFYNDNLTTLKASINKDGGVVGLGFTGNMNALGGVLTSALATPVNAAFSTLTTGGTLAPGTYYYRVAALSPTGTTLASTETSIVVPAGTSTNTVTVNWAAVPSAAGYNVYGRTTGAETLLAAAAGTALTLVDTGGALIGTALPAANTTAIVSSVSASGVDGFKLLDGAYVNFSTADAGAVLYRSAANVLRTPSAFIAASLGLGSVAGSTQGIQSSGNDTYVNAQSTAAVRLRSSGGTEFLAADANGTTLSAALNLSSYTNDSATSGNRTVNKVRGKNTIAAGASTCVITNSFVTAESQVLVTLEFVDATATFIKACIPAAGSFTLTVNANATAATKFSWTIIN